jgi:hypothetical protein
METTLDLGKLDLEKFLLQERTCFLHFFKEAALALTRSHEEEFSHFRHTLAHKVNNYRLTLRFSQYELPNTESKSQLYQLIGWMDVLWDGRRILKKDEVIHVSDNIVASYESLTETLQQRGIPK